MPASRRSGLAREEEPQLDPRHRRLPHSSRPSCARSARSCRVRACAWPAKSTTPRGGRPCFPARTRRHCADVPLVARA